MRYKKICNLWIVPVMIATSHCATQLAAQSQASSSVPRDQRAIEVLSKSLEAMGGSRSVGNIKDFTSTGKITYFLGGGKVPGTAKIMGRDAHEFRFESELPKGKRIVAFGSHHEGFTEENGKTKKFQTHDTNVNGFRIPAVAIWGSLSDPSLAIASVGAASVGGNDCYQIRIQKNFGEKDGFQGILSQLSVEDFFIDSKSFLPVAIRRISHPSDNFRQRILEQLTLSDFRLGKFGVLVPYSITETLAGQLVWEFHADSVELNTNLAESDFEN